MSTKGLVIVLWCLLIAGLHVTSASSVTLFLIGETSSTLRSVSKTTMGISYFVLGEYEEQNVGDGQVWGF